MRETKNPGEESHKMHRALSAGVFSHARGLRPLGSPRLPDLRGLPVDSILLISLVSCD